VELDGPFASLLAPARAMAVAEKKALLVSAGILTADGELAPHYRAHESAVKKVLAAKKRKKARV
jgi:hypothetical protein